ncbi:MAG: HAD family phosphatase, partial [Pseudomonadota bacterium]
MSRTSFDAVLFDCDGVLVDSEALGLDASAEYLKGHGLDWPPAELVRRFTGLRDDVFAQKLIAAYREANGADPDTDFFQGLVNARRSLAHLLETVAGAREAIEATPVARAVASSSRAAVLEKKLKRTELWGLFDPHVYSAELVDHGKPAPD